MWAEHGSWTKCTNWEIDARIPFIVRAPWIAASVGQKTHAIAEAVDVSSFSLSLSLSVPVAESYRIYR